MSEEDKDNINKEGDVKVDENQPGGENKPTEPETVQVVQEKALEG